MGLTDDLLTSFHPSGQERWLSGGWCRVCIAIPDQPEPDTATSAEGESSAIYADWDDDEADRL
jgi:hypothetical protein